MASHGHQWRRQGVRSVLSEELFATLCQPFGVRLLLGFGRDFRRGNNGGKQRVTILLDTGLIEYFKAKAGERGYQTLINDTLRRAKERENLEETLRRIVREELHRDTRSGSI